jgi:FkbM family methyltransferase
MKFSKYLTNLNKPELLFRPAQLLKNFKQRLTKKINNAHETVTLPWKAEIKVYPNDEIGRSISRTGIYDLVATEVLWRLIDKGEVCLDIGANIGYMTSLMAAKVTTSGSVYCYEPHPENYEDLSNNIANWREALGWNHIDSKKIAVSDSTGKKTLVTPDGFQNNRGLSSIASADSTFTGQSYVVSSSTLDVLFDCGSNLEIGVLKIDIEGHELEALNGAKELIAARKIRDIIFEQYGTSSYPNAITDYLEGNGYTIFKAISGFWGPIVLSPDNEQSGRSWEPPCYIATIQPKRVEERTQKKGWYSLRNLS